MLVSCLTDNKNRTVAEVRHAFNKYGESGQMACELFIFAARYCDCCWERG